MSESGDAAARVLVVGTGMAGVAAATALRAGGAAVDVVDMGENPGGRLAVRDLDGTGTRWDGHIVDVGAAYFTVSDSEFAAQVSNWRDAGLVREWFDSAVVIDGSGAHSSTGPMRYAAPRGLRSITRAMLDSLPAGPDFVCSMRTKVTSVVASGDRLRVGMVDQRSSAMSSATYSAVILACPDPQALRLLPDDALPDLRRQLAESTWLPVITHTMVFEERTWPAGDFWFVNDSAVVANVADDGARRGDGAAVLVAHSTAEHAQAHFDDADSASPAMEAEVARVLGIDVVPSARITKRWGLARPAQGREQRYAWDAAARLAVCGDGWAGKPRIEAAWLSGTAAARQVLAAEGTR